MNHQSTQVSSAQVLLGLFRYSNHRALWLVSTQLPGADRSYSEGWCDLREPDEPYTWANDFHGESKAWRSLMDCVASDWSASQQPLFPASAG